MCVQENHDKNRPVIKGKKIAIFSFGTFLISAVVRTLSLYPRTHFVAYCTKSIVCECGYEEKEFVCHSFQLSFVLFWIPGVSEAILQRIVGVPHQLAALSVNPLRVFAFFCFTGEEGRRWGGNKGWRGGGVKEGGRWGGNKGAGGVR